ncbi:hypothetical protein FJZ19_02250 [Candidatus Pacearchaeota archaeon]|nr:hypothetical protein [Candidatus Pacearchaeota archaeon]
MLTKEEAKEKIAKLVKEFSEIHKAHLDSMPEEDIKFQFIEPLFEALGWERKDISKEKRVLKGRADYILKLGNQEVLVIEAKKTNVSLMEEEGRQTVSYAYHRKIKFAILTNFKDIRVYHALSNIKNIDKNLLKVNNAYFRLNVSEFLDKFDLLWLLSKESFEQQEINKLLSAKDEKLNKPVDESILDDLLNIRSWLSKELKVKKNYLEQEKIDEIIQILIDRLIFIRSVEDRGLEPMNYLKSLESDVRQQQVKLQLFPYLLEKFAEFNKKYDSKLFEPGLLEKEGAFSDDILRKVILTLYSGTENNQERYLFDQIPGDLFGSIYEQYLGTILASTEKRVKLESGSGKRKKMGIYYTPSYIVDYIVKNSVKEYIKDKSIDEILQVKIVDPACGSGSFLIRAFQEVCDKIEDLLKAGKRSEKWTTFKNYKERLSLGQKAMIMGNCIYGVDLDEKAVELARLNLLLKMLEGEDQESKKLMLPHLGNIKCGNSLIDDPKVSDKAFKWEVGFKDVMASGGFDVVIGNPPYIRIQTLSGSYKKIAESYSKNYESAQGNYDIYSLFVEKGIKILKEKGKLGFILPNKFFISNYGKPLRDFITKQEYLKEVINFKDNQIFERASTYTCLLFLQKSLNKKIKYSEMANIDKISEYLDIISQKKMFDNSELKIGEINLIDLGDVWNFNVGNCFEIINKLLSIRTTLKDYKDKYFQGVATSADSIYLVKIIEDLGDKIRIRSEATNKEYVIEKELTRKLVKGKDISRYFVDYSNRILIFPYVKRESGYEPLSEEEIKKYKGVYNYFKELEDNIKNREHKKLSKSKSWFALTYPRSINLYDLPKIMTPNSAFRPSFYFDETTHYYMTCGVAGGFAIILKNNSEVSSKYLLAILNSKLMNFLNKNIGTSLQGGYYSYDPKIICRYPIKIASKNPQQKIISLVEEMLELQKKYHDEKISGNEKERLKQQIDNVDYEIDEEVYKLYGITDEEKKIIEESLKSKPD